MCEHNREKRRCIECGGSAAAASPSQKPLSSGGEVESDEDVDTAEPEEAATQGTAAVEPERASARGIGPGEAAAEPVWWSERRPRKQTKFYLPEVFETVGQTARARAGQDKDAAPPPTSSLQTQPQTRFAIPSRTGLSCRVCKTLRCTCKPQSKQPGPGSISRLDPSVEDHVPGMDLCNEASQKQLGGKPDGSGIDVSGTDVCKEASQKQVGGKANGGGIIKRSISTVQKQKAVTFSTTLHWDHTAGGFRCKAPSLMSCNEQPKADSFPLLLAAMKRREQKPGENEKMLEQAPQPDAAPPPSGDVALVTRKYEEQFMREYWDQVRRARTRSTPHTRETLLRALPEAPETPPRMQLRRCWDPVPAKTRAQVGLQAKARTSIRVAGIHST